MSKGFHKIKNKKFDFKNSIFSFFAGFIFVISIQNSSAQCTVGSSGITWVGAGSGTQSVIPTSGSAGGPPSPVVLSVPGCTNTNSANPFNVTTTITEVVGNVYDAMRSGTSGLYAQPGFTITIDNVDNGCITCDNTTNPPIPNGSRVDVTFTFQYPVLLSALRIDDIDAADTQRAPAGQSSFQDQVTVSALGITGANVPLSLSLGAAGNVNISGQTATAVWVSGGNNNVTENDPLGQVTVSSTQSVKSVTISYLVGPNAINAAQQGIRIGTFNFCCPVVVDLAGAVFNDCNALDNNTVDGTGLGNPAGTTLYANLVEPSTNRVIGVSTVAANGTYSINNIPGNVTYNVVLSTTQGVVGNPPPSASLPSGWSNTGEKFGTGTGSDGTANGILTNVVVGSTNTTNANFGIRATPTCIVTNNGPICQGGIANFTESGVNGASWSWTGPNGFVSNSRNPSKSSITSADAGVYSVTITNSNGCTTSCTTNLVVAPATSVSATVDNSVICAGNSFTINGTETNGVLREFFANINGTALTNLTSSPNYPNSPTSNEILPTAIGPSGIADNYGTRVRYYLTPTVSGVYQFVIYGDDETQLFYSGSSASSPLTTIASIPDWTNVGELTKYPSQQTANITLVAGQQYYFELLQKEGSGGDHYGILWKLPSSGTYTNIPTANISPSLVSWSGPNGFTSNSLTNTISGATTAQGGVYTLTSTDLYGCVKTATVNVTVNPLPAANAGNSGPFCEGSTISLSSSGGSTYSWAGPAGFVSSIQNPTRVNATLSMSGIYTVTVTNSFGCTQIATTNVMINPKPNAVLSSQTNVSCFGGSNGAVVITPSGGTSPYTITPIQTGLTAGAKTFTVTDANGCTTTVNATISQPASLPTVVLTSQTNVLCRGNSTGAINITASGGTGPYTYDWADVAGTSNTEDRTALA
ncbi:hypothetical protein EGI22_12570, partial [Lacihabitans sp. LS3-19]